VIIEKEEINNRIYKDGKPTTDNPDWKDIQNKIKTKYNAAYADRIVLWSKIKWFEYKKDWPEYCKNVILKVEKYGPYDKVFYYIAQPSSSLYNFSAWEIFMYSKDPAQLEKALEWSDKSVKTSAKPDAEFLDTYANILYKLGRKEEALAYEQKAIALNPKATDIQDNIEKIQKGEPTWATK
jgi:tetratricopeptide (TPR) repeat protein